MGPQATLDLYQRIIDLTSVNTDQEHIPVLIDSYPQIEDRTAFILGKGPDPTNKLIESAQRLEKGGAQAIIMACNTAHYFADSIQNATNIPLLHIAEVTLSNLKKSFSPFTTIAVLATDGTQKAGIYQDVLEAN
ncbi:Aspartate racemase [Suttonella ornithocola]|uniref:Aspartate racemase n=1 Tax=Suttonella ornithocola TaxID=279832 RepID=A0A380MY95_9GAMM|nr:Aspartate racemase [Suttonella ornithocola]